MAVIEQRYAQALADLVRKGDVDAATLRRELGELTTMLDSSPALRTVLGSPAVAWETKLALLDTVARRAGVSRIARNFLVVATQRGRVGLVAGIDTAFEQLLLDQSGTTLADIASARAMGPAERTALEAQLTKLVGGKLRVQYREDAALVGGFTARVGDKVYDGSVRGRLQRLRESLAAN